MNSKQLTELTSRVVSGEPLTPDEERQLLQWMETRPTARDELVASEELDTLLRCLGHFAETEDEFVNATLRCLSETKAAPSLRPVKAHATKFAPARYSSVAGNRTFRANRLERVLALSATVLLMGSLAALVWMGLRSVVNSQPSPRLSEEQEQDQDDRSLPIHGFAYVASMDGVVWDTPHATGERLAAGVLKLVQGESVIRFDKGTEARLTGPAVLDLRSPDEVILTRGSLSVSVPRQAVGFTVGTPVGRVVDLGTVFDVSVESSGQTETVVRQGKVVFSPQSTGGIPGKPIELTASGLDRAVSSVPSISAPTLPVSTIVRGTQGRFMGVISAGGQTLEFGSLEAFEGYQAQVLKQLLESPADFERQWSTMVKASAERRVRSTSDAGAFEFGTAGGAQSRSVSISENGKTVSITESTGNGITITITESIGGKPRQIVVKAASVEELKEKNAEAFRFYDRYLGAGK